MLKNITNPYMIKIKTLVANPVAGIYPSSQSVTLSSSTSDASIYYTTDGSTPTEASTLYEGAISISETTTLKAKAFKTNWADSDVFVAEYIIEVALEQVATPTSDPEPNSLITNVSLDCVTNDAIIYYTIDGSIPTRSSNIYISDIILSVDSNTTINAFAIKDGYDDSDMFSGWFISPDNSCSPFI
jgi:chitinase